MLLRAEEPPAGWSDTGDWRAHWLAPHEVQYVPGDHFAIVEEHAAITANLVREWLVALRSSVVV